MSFYRVTVLDPNGIIFDSRMVDSLADAAKTVLRYTHLVDSSGNRHLLDADGEIMVRVKGAGDRELTADEKAGISALLEEFGATYLEPDAEGGLWGYGERETGS